MDIFAAAKTLGEFAKNVGSVITVAEMMGVLISKGRQTWTYLVGEEEEELVEKDDVAVMVQINQFLVTTTKKFLENEGIDAHLILITNVEDGSSIEYLDNDKKQEWIDVVADFFDAVTGIERDWGAKTLHVFLAAPAALAFALGCKMSVQHNIRLYNWMAEERSYVRVLTVPRDIR